MRSGHTSQDDTGYQLWVVRFHELLLTLTTTRPTKKCHLVSLGKQQA